MSEEHPLEKALDIEPGSTPSLITVEKTTEVVAQDSPYSVINPDNGEVMALPVDDVTQQQLVREERVDDLRINEQLTSIHDKATAAFNYYIGSVEQVEPRYAARHGEVAAQFLNVALASTNSRISAKAQRVKERALKQLGSGPRTVQNNLVVADRNDVLKSIFNPSFNDSVSEVVKEVTDDPAK